MRQTLLLAWRLPRHLSFHTFFKKAFGMKICMYGIFKIFFLLKIKRRTTYEHDTIR